VSVEEQQWRAWQAHQAQCKAWWRVNHTCWFDCC
jgi:hypothetical protein